MSMPSTDHAASSRTAPAARDYVFTFSYESLADARRRGMMRPPDRLVSTLMTSPEVNRLLIADAYRAWGTAWRREPFDFLVRPRQTQKVRHVRPLRSERADPEDVAAIEQVYVNYEGTIRDAADRAHLDEPRFITANPLVAGFCDLSWAGPALYYGRDDWLSSPARRQYWPAYREAYARLARSGRAVAAVSQEIIDRIEPEGPHLVVPNGIEPEEWLGDQPAPPEWFARIPGPRAVYVGTLDSRLDIDGLYDLATRRPDLQLVLLGPIPDKTFLERAAALANVHVHGSVNRRHVVAVLRNAELTLLSHQRTALTKAMSPLKVYEYLAAGRPVLATDLRPVRGLGPRVHLAPTVSDFADLVDVALSQGVQDEAERVAFVEDNAWAARHRSILTLVNG
ncbi:glycosyltransferase [uncultured Demequina sp.]|uniref:glycosyltransferase n=1 Tax=uncultured Demequina sp. TaxID=693499 RepID=UPI0025D4FB16|nr:glycosyltransferase [uncultured Demequina sp.]